MIRLEAIRGRWAAATPGPWWSTRDLQPSGIYSGEGSGSDVCVADVLRAKDARAIAHAPADIAALTAAVEGVLALHRIVKIYNECECPPGTHSEDYDYIDCQDYNGCHNSITGIGCDECCVDGDFLSEACGESHNHSMDAATRCGTVRAITTALDSQP